MQLSDRVSQAHEVLQLAVAVAEKWSEVVPWLLDNPERVTQLGRIRNVCLVLVACPPTRLSVDDLASIGPSLLIEDLWLTRTFAAVVCFVCRACMHWGI